MTAMEKNNKTLNVPHLRFPEFSGEWDHISLSDIADIVGGGTPDTSVVEYWGGNIQWFTPSEIGKEKYARLSERTITEAGIKNSSAKLLPQGTVLLSSRATIGECSIARQECTTNQGFQSLIAKTDTVTSEFLYYLVPTIKKEMLRRSCGSTFLEISANELRKIYVYRPSLIEQNKLAEFMSLLDLRIETQKKIIEKYESLIKGIRRNLLKFESSVRTCNLKDICKITTGKLDANAMEEDGVYPFFTCAENSFTINTYAFDTEALLVSGNGANVGYINYCNGKFNAYQRTYVLYDFSVNIHYVRYYMDAFLRQRIDQEKNVGNTPYIVLSTLADMKICIPSHARQLDVCRVIKALENKLTLEIDLYNSYRRVKDFLLRRMFI